jgi:hypothetical protein
MRWPRDPRIRGLEGTRREGVPIRPTRSSPLQDVPGISSPGCGRATHIHLTTSLYILCYVGRDSRLILDHLHAGESGLETVLPEMLTSHWTELPDPKEKSMVVNDPALLPFFSPRPPYPATSSRPVISIDSVIDLRDQDPKFSISCFRVNLPSER